METARTKSGASERTRSVVFVGLAIAIIAVSAWVTVPIGPVPVTLQMFAITFAIVVLKPKEAVAAIAGYLLLGAVGVPVFSGMRGGIGVLAGPTGGFLWGYLIGVPLACLFLQAVRSVRAKRARSAAASAPSAVSSSAPKQSTVPPRRARVVDFLRTAGFEIVAGVVFTVVAYICGCAQYMAVANVSLAAAIATAVAPFAVIDLCKIAAAVICAQAVNAAVK